MKTGLHALAPALSLAPELAPPRAQVVVAAAGASVQHLDPQDPAGASVKYQDSQEPPVLAPPSASAVVAAAGAGFSVPYQGRTTITWKSAHGRRERSPATSNRKTKDDPQRQKTADEHTHTHATQHTAQPASRPPRLRGTYQRRLSTCSLRWQQGGRLLA